LKGLVDSSAEMKSGTQFISLYKDLFKQKEADERELIDHLKMLYLEHDQLLTHL